MQLSTSLCFYLSIVYLSSEMAGAVDTKMDYDIVPIDRGRKLEILTFLQKYFFRDDPINKAIKLVEKKDDRCLELEHLCAEIVDKEMSISFMAINRTTEEIVGIQLNEDLKLVQVEDIDQCDNIKFKEIHKLLMAVKKKSKLEKLISSGKPRILDAFLISVHPQSRGKKIATELARRTLNEAKKAGYQYIYMGCSSHYSALLCEKLKFEKICELKFTDYTDEHGHPIFTPELPHTKYVTYLKSM